MYDVDASSLMSKVILTLYVNNNNNNKKWKNIDCGLLSWICLWFILWVLTNPNIAGNCFHFLLVRGISGESHGQIPNLWICDFEPTAIVLLMGLSKMYMSDHIIRATIDNWHSFILWIYVFIAWSSWLGNCFLYGDLGIKCGPWNIAEIPLCGHLFFVM